MTFEDEIEKDILKDESFNEPEYEVVEGLKDEGLSDDEINELLEDDSTWSDDDVEKAIEELETTKDESIVKEIVKLSDPLEIAKQKLRDEQENVYENPEKKYVEIDIPSTGKVGEELVVKFSKKVPKAQIAISEKLEWKRLDKYNPKSEYKLIPSRFNFKEVKDVDKVSIELADYGFVGQKKVNNLRAGEYLIEARGWSTQGGEETTARRLVKVSK